MRFLLVDDHLLVAQAIATLLAEFCDLELQEICTNIAQANGVIRQCCPDLLILDLHFPGESWTDAAEPFLRHNPDGKIVLLTAHAGSLEVPGVLGSSLLGVISKTEAWTELVALVNRWLSECGDALSLSGWQEQALQSLSPREHRVLQALGRGLLNRQIAAELGLSPLTVDTYRKQISSKLGVSGSELVRLAVLQRLRGAMEPPQAVI